MIQRLHPRPRSRAGITLTEILISIMIMGIGLLSLATLFPLGLLRIREANRASRSARLVESAMSDMQGRNLLNKQLFLGSWYPGYDPFILDLFNRANATDLTTMASDGGIYRQFGKGVPIAYDPLWWYETYINSNGTVTPANTPARFASGIGWLRNDPNAGGGSSAPSAHGLQRISNFNHMMTTVGAEVERTFASTDDILFQSDGTPSTVDGIGNPLVPDLSAGGMVVDLSYTWIFTGNQVDVTNASQFDGEIVVFHNRPFGLETVASPIDGSSISHVRGETVVEAIFGYGPPLADGYALSNTTVLLRWPQAMPDPDIRIGGYIADVTYERNLSEAYSRFDNQAAANGLTGEIYPSQRCYWYRIVKRTDPMTVGGYRQMVVNINTPVRAKTKMSAIDTPYHVNAAFVSPYVVNVVPRTFYIR